MRIRDDGKHAYRTSIIDQAAEFWSCKKTTAFMWSAEFSWRIDERIREVLERYDLTVTQKQEIAERLRVPRCLWL
ncbi:hypothetical protein EGH22_19240 [Halomicroarcula sp. F28]|uniref:DUF7692 domain-containing protein n=1 Tax=Haloarcula salinisoli TaxID=2487746 RepID=UPI001C736D04|nr:hypothetical protein [Halomicroarcula salinisoli]MBX0288470.1 hypothetical protein [Halomicroarcula salinisoli]